LPVGRGADGGENTVRFQQAFAALMHTTTTTTTKTK
jgi:hypothetical protein